MRGGAGGTIGGLKTNKLKENKLKEALPLFQSAIKINPDPVEPPSLIKKVLV